MLRGSKIGFSSDQSLMQNKTMLNLADVTFNNAQIALTIRLFTLSLPERCQFATESMVVG